MPRRAKKKTGASTGQIVGLIGGFAFIMITAVAVLVLFLGGGGDGESGGGRARAMRSAAGNELNLSDYLDNANALRGNAYRVTGTVEEQLRWTPDRGRLISVEIKTGSSGSPVPVLVPHEFSHVNIEKGSRLNLVVEVGNNGLLIARDISSG